MAAGPFATLEDYELRYGPAADPARITALLGDASAYIAAQPGFREIAEGGDGYEAQRANLVRATCAVVHRSVTAGDWAGISNMSQGAVGISASVTFSNPSGDFYLTKGERAALGIGTGRVGATDPFGCGR